MRLETKNNLLTNLFKGYSACRDKVFLKYIARKQEVYKGRVDFFPNILIHLAVHIYKLLKTTIIWNELS